MSWNLELEPKKHILTTIMYNKHYLYLKYEVTAHSFHYKSFLEGYFIFLPFPGLPSIPPYDIYNWRVGDRHIIYGYKIMNIVKLYVRCPLCSLSM